MNEICLSSQGHSLGERGVNHRIKTTSECTISHNALPCDLPSLGFHFGCVQGGFDLVERGLLPSIHSIHFSYGDSVVNHTSERERERQEMAVEYVCTVGVLG